MNITNTIYCPLCYGLGNVFYEFKKQLYHQCQNCKGVFVDRSLVLDSDSEILRYREHNNDVNDLRYQLFVKPITDAILNDFSKNNIGLDFGAGTGPVISKLLLDADYQIKQYDPYFYNNPKLLESKYDYIVCCEVIEHFNNPNQEFALLRKLLKPNGKLYCMTNIYDESIDFHKWYYKNDKTHVFIYHENSLNWIKDKFGFSNVTIIGRLVVYIF